jgi:hypothetical protein
MLTIQYITDYVVFPSFLIKSDFRSPGQLCFLWRWFLASQLQGKMVSRLSLDHQENRVILGPRNLPNGN